MTNAFQQFPTRIPSYHHTMYRVTFSQAVSDAWRSRITLPDIKQRRVYRWGTLWCSCDPWTCERRTVEEDTEECRVERCETITCDRLPMEVDDIWEEDVCAFPKGLEYNGLVSVKGGRESVLETVAAHGLPTPSLPVTMTVTKAVTTAAVPSQTHTHQPHTQTKPKPKSRCLIAD